MKVNLIVPGYPARVGHVIPAIELYNALQENGVNTEISDKPKKGCINHAHVNTPFEVLTRADLFTIYGPLGFTFRSTFKKLELNKSFLQSKHLPVLFIKAIINSLPPALKWPRLSNVNIVVTCKYLKDFLRKHFITADIKVIPPPVKPPYSAPQPLQKNNKKILFTGKGFAERGEIELLKAAPMVLNKNPNAEFIIANKSYEKYKHRYLKLIQELEIEENVKFFGNLKRRKIRELLEECSLAVYPYITPSPASVPLSLMEAMAYGKPIISTRFGSIPEIIESGESGILIEPEDTESLSESIVKLLNDFKLRKRLGRKAFRKVKNENNPSKIADEYIKIYKKLKY